MTRDELGARVRTIISEHLTATYGEPPAFTDESAFIADLDLDSLDIVEVAMAVEDAFDLEIGDGDIEQFKTVADLINYLVARLGLIEVAA
jgi:acyl carrier protein